MALRDSEIVDLRVAGWTLAQIAERYGLSRQRVAQIVDASACGRVPAGRASQARRVHRREVARRDNRAGEVLALWRQGVPRRKISLGVGVTLEAIREIVAAHATDEDSAARRDACRARHASGLKPRFSDSNLLGGLRVVAQRLGHAPTVSEYRSFAPDLGLAAMPTVYARFGGWGAALEAAGLTSRSRTRGRRAARWNTAACWNALLSVADQLGDPPRYRRYTELAADRDDLPSGPTLTLRLGLWSEIVTALAERRADACVGALVA